MNITVLRSDEIYKKMANAAGTKKEDIYRYELMKPFEAKWQCIGVPLKSEQDGGYDVVLAGTMGSKESDGCYDWRLLRRWRNSGIYIWNHHSKRSIHENAAGRPGA